MAIKVITYPLEDSSDIFNYAPTLETIRKRNSVINPFDDLKFLYSCLETTGCEEAYLNIIFNNDEPQDFIVLKNSHGESFRTAIPVEVPHFNTFSITSNNTAMVVSSILSKFNEIFIPRVLINKQKADTLSNSSQRTLVGVSTMHKLQVPDDFDRWLYRVKPRNQEKFEKLLKTLSRDPLVLSTIDDPLNFQREIEISFAKSSNIPMLVRSIISAILFQLKLSNFKLYYATLSAENWEIAGSVSLEYEGRLYLLFIWDFYRDVKTDARDLLLLLLLKKAHHEGLTEIVILDESRGSSIPMEDLLLFDIHMKQ